MSTVRAPREQAASSDRLAELENLLRSLGSVAIGFSGGVDSSFLAAVCERCMPDRALLVHLTTPLIGTPEQRSFERSTRAGGARDGAGPRFSLPVVELRLNPLENPQVARNDTDRCYRCKLAGFGAIVSEARARGLSTVIDGSNADDAGDYRPGMRAAAELGVRSPLLETGWHKKDERALLRAWGYPVWNMPAGACLATRVPTGEPLTAEKLDAVRRCEDYLHGLGMRQVRVRLADGRARVAAAPDDLARLAARRGDAAGAGETGTGERDGGILPTGGVKLPAAVLRGLRARGVAEIDPVAVPYRHGAMNAPGA